ncbi:hypothetical protein GCM10009575_059090 [Streptomyces rhizosphaericus]|uniref:Integrase catalytic domain-containing protein n=1 Tax=Streptomyces rhizosphaericus TaxID=114699 RepID=A0ABP4AXB3_9ACTN
MLVVDALRMAHGRSGLEAGCILHSDRGSEYTSAEFRAGDTVVGLRQSWLRIADITRNPTGPWITQQARNYPMSLDDTRSR